MGTDSPSAGDSVPRTGVEPAAAPGGLRRAGRGGAVLAWVGVAAGLALVKGDGLVAVLQHRVELIAFLGVGLVASVLRTRPVGIALTAAALLAFALAPGSTALGVGLGLGAFMLLLALFIAIGMALHARQDRDRVRL